MVYKMQIEMLNINHIVEVEVYKNHLTFVKTLKSDECYVYEVVIVLRLYSVETSLVRR